MSKRYLEEKNTTLDLFALSSSKYRKERLADSDSVVSLINNEIVDLVGALNVINLKGDKSNSFSLSDRGTSFFEDDSESDSESDSDDHPVSTYISSRSIAYSNNKSPIVSVPIYHLYESTSTTKRYVGLSDWDNTFFLQLTSSTVENIISGKISLSSMNISQNKTDHIIDDTVAKLYEKYCKTFSSQLRKDIMYYKRRLIQEELPNIKTKNVLRAFIYGIATRVCLRSFRHQITDALSIDIICKEMFSIVLEGEDIMYRDEFIVILGDSINKGDVFYRIRELFCDMLCINTTNKIVDILLQ